MGMLYDFCEEKECRLYNLLKKLELIEDPSPLVKRKKEIIQARCKQNCEHTAYEFCEWLKIQKVEF
jgi:hypothetical protein